MMIDFIFGEAGSGKSTYIYKWITKEAAEHPSQQYFLFVPEQNTLKAQREIIKYSECHGMLNLDVLSFQLLAYRVMQELGVDKPVVIDEVSKSILIRKAAADNADKLKVYRSKIASDGFIRQIKSVISEFYQYEVNADRLREAEDEVSLPLLKGKLSDMALIYESFQAMIRDRAAIPEELSYMLLKLMGRSKLLKDAIIVFDGYTGFTPIQTRLLEHIIPDAQRCRFAVTIPVSAAPYSRVGSKLNQGDTSDIYMLSRDTVARVCEAAELNNVPRSGETEIKHNRKRARLGIVRTADPVEEVRYAARNIRKLAMSGKYRYSEIAVAVSDTSGYGELIRREFTREEIPYFMDDRTEALESPAVLMVKQVLKLICGGYRLDDMTALFKNPLVASDAELKDSSDLVDNYLRRTGRRGRKTFELLSAELKLSGVTELETALKDASDISAMSEAVRAFMSNIGLSERTELYALKLEVAGFVREADEARHFNELTDELLERMKVILGEEKCSIDEYRKLLDAGFSDMKGGSIPEKMDTVLIGDLKRSRLDDIRCLFVLGANDGLIPSAVTGGGILTDHERIELMNADIELAPDDKRDSTIQRFYLMLLFNKPTELLNISYAAAGRDGKAKRPSSVLNELINGEYGSFDNIEDTVNDAGSELEALSSVYDALMYTAQKAEHINAEDEEFFDVYKALKAAGKDEELDRLISAAFTEHKKDSLSKAAASKLYGELLRGSVSRIEKYEGCPFAHFANYGLGLKEREQFKIRSMDVGNMFHSALDKVFREVKARNKQLTDINDEELGSIIAVATEESLSEFNDNILESSARNQYIADKIRKTTKHTVNVLKKQLGEGDFKANDTEVTFRFDEDNISLRGKIDRIDSCEDKGNTFVKIIDYKSGDKEFSIEKLVNGLQLQLITYMESAVRLLGERVGDRSKVIPAGMFYYHIDEPILKYDRKSGVTAEHAEEKRLESQKMKGAMTDLADAARHIDNALVSEADCGQIENAKLKASQVVDSKTELLTRNEFDGLMDYAHQRIVKDAEKILNGDINIRPTKEGGRSGCEYCAFGSLCGFDTQLAGFDYRRPRKLNKDTIKKLIGGQTIDEDSLE